MEASCTGPHRSNRSSAHIHAWARILSISVQFTVSCWMVAGVLEGDVYGVWIHMKRPIHSNLILGLT